MLLPLKNMTGGQAGEIEVSDAVFAAPINPTLMHQAVLRQLSNARLGTHKTKTRGEVAGGGRKPWRQKGTGRARQGSTRAPQWVGGGVAFGPVPHTYIKAMPKKMLRAAIRSALSVKAGAGQLIVLDSLTLDAPKTKEMAKMFKALGVYEQNVLFVMAEKDVPIFRSTHNLAKVKTVLGGNLNVRDILGNDVLILPREAVAFVESWLGTEASAEVAESLVAEGLVAEGGEE